jgi:hypothetical protein
MSHIRTQVRNYVRSKLLNGATNAENRIYKSKIDAHLGEEPIIGIYTHSERKLERTTNAPEYRKEFTVELQVIVRENDTWDEELDDLCRQIEQLLDFDYYLGGMQSGLVESFEPDETDILHNDKAEQQYAMAKMTYKATYLSSQDDNSSTLDNFNTFHGDIDANDPTTTGELGPDGQIDADVHITDLYSD